MKTCWALAALLAAGAAAAAQDDPDSLRREHDRAMRALEERQKAEREKIDRDFQDRLDRAAKPHRDLERRCEELLRQIEELAAEVRRLQARLGGGTPDSADPKRAAQRALEELQRRFPKGGKPQEFEFEIPNDDGGVPRMRAKARIFRLDDPDGKPQMFELEEEDGGGEIPKLQKRMLELKKRFQGGGKPEMFELDEDEDSPRGAPERAFKLQKRVEKKAPPRKHEEEDEDDDDDSPRGAPDPAFKIIEPDGKPQIFEFNGEGGAPALKREFRIEPGKDGEWRVIEPKAKKSPKKDDDRREF